MGGEYIGTVRSNRMGGASMMINKEGNKSASKAGRPSFFSSPRVFQERKKASPPQRPGQSQPDVCYDNYGLLPLHCDMQGRCNLCPKCQKCNVFLCLNAHQQCFAAYHQKSKGSNAHKAAVASGSHIWGSFMKFLWEVLRESRNCIFFLNNVFMYSEFYHKEKSRASI